MTVLFMGTTNTEYTPLGGATVDTTSTHFDSDLSPCALYSGSVGGNRYWESIKDHSATEFYFTALAQADGSNGNTNNAKTLVFLDEDFIERIRIVGTGTAGRFRVEKVNAALSATQIGNNFLWFPTIQANQFDKITVYINNAASGQIIIWINGIKVFDSGTVDTTTDGVDTIVRHWLGNSGSAGIFWHAAGITDYDLRSKYVVCRAPVANGTTHNWDTGSPAAANVNEVSVDDSTLDGSSIAGQIDGYTIANLPSGTFAVLHVAISMRVQRGSSGPTKLAGGVRVNGTNYFGSDHTCDIAWENIQPGWDESPDTSSPWTTAEVNAGNFNIMARSAA